MKYYTKIRTGSDNLHFRIKYNKLDVTIKMPYLIDRTDFDSKKKIFKEDEDINHKIIEHRRHFMKSFNEALDLRVPFDIHWVKEVNEKYFKPEADSLTLLHHLIMYRKKTMSVAVYKKLGTVISKVRTIPSVKIKNVGLEWMTNYASEMKKRGYANSSINKNTALIKQVIRDCDANEIEIRRSALSYRSLKEETVTHYLNNEELETIYNYVPKSPTLDNTRKLLLIGCYTGLRVSDLMRIKDFEIKGGIMNLQMKKTKGYVAIPIHKKIAPFIDEVYPLAPQVYNRNIKKLLKLMGFTDLTQGYTRGKNNRRVFGTYPKYKLISSHSARKSFASNLYGVIPVEVIMAVGGWRTHSSLLKYIRRPQLSYAEQLKEFYNKI